MKLLAYTGNTKIDPATEEESDGFEPVPGAGADLLQVLIERYWRQSREIDIQIFVHDTDELELLWACAKVDPGAKWLFDLIHEESYTILRLEE